MTVHDVPVGTEIAVDDGKFDARYRFTVKEVTGHNNLDLGITVENLDLDIAIDKFIERIEVNFGMELPDDLTEEIATGYDMSLREIGDRLKPYVGLAELKKLNL